MYAKWYIAAQWQPSPSECTIWHGRREARTYGGINDAVAFVIVLMGRREQRANSLLTNATWNCQNWKWYICSYVCCKCNTEEHNIEGVLGVAYALKEIYMRMYCMYCSICLPIREVVKVLWQQMRWLQQSIVKICHTHTYATHTLISYNIFAHMCHLFYKINFRLPQATASAAESSGSLIMFARFFFVIYVFVAIGIYGISSHCCWSSPPHAGCWNSRLHMQHGVNVCMCVCDVNKCRY